MKTSTHPLRRLLLAWLFLALAGIAGAQTTVRLSTRFVARGEQALLEVGSIGREPEALPHIPRIANVTLQPASLGSQPRMLPGRRIEYSFQYILTSYEVGKHVIPPIEIVVDGRRRQTEPLEFVVFDPDQLQWLEADLGGRPIRYAAAFLTTNTNPFEGETLPTEIKIYVPREIAATVEDWGVPEFERDGVASWRFEPADIRGQVNLLGKPYISLAYPSTMTPSRTGPVEIGPATVRLTTVQVIMNRYAQRVHQEVYLQIPKLEFEARPLPPGAPEGFENAIGSFKIQAHTTDTSVREGEPISVDLVVEGSGNLDTLRPPQLLDPTGWKTYDATANERGEERRDLAGTIVFRQFMRPLEMKSMIPPFRLAYFDPADEIYKTVVTEPIALEMQPGPALRVEPTGPPPSVATPVERMDDILGIVRATPLAAVSGRSFPWWTLHLVAGLIALALAAKAIGMRLASRFQKDPSHHARLASLKAIERQAPDDTAFLRAAGSHIERWLGDREDPELRHILAERDAISFRADRPASTMDTKRRQEILRILRKATFALAAFGLFFASAPAARANDIAERAQQAYDSAKYEEALKLWLSGAPFDQLSADSLYNIGNASYRLGSPGHAALYYQRALLRDPSHAEARQNLRFLHRKHGSIAIQRSAYQVALAKIPLSGWQGIASAGGWLIVLGLLAFAATRPRARARFAGTAALIAGPLLAAFGALGWYYFPDDAAYASLERQAIITAPKAVVYSEAARTSPEVIDAPPGSLCEIIKKSGDWIYVSFAGKTRGWVPAETVEKLIPDQTPGLPEIRKPEADGSSA